MKKGLVCLNNNQKYNPETGECCKTGYQWEPTIKKCQLLGGDKTSPAKNCMHVFEIVGGSAKDGYFWVKPTSSITAFQVWCTFKGDYKGAGLMMRKPGNVNGMEKIGGSRSVPCNVAGGGDSRGYCKLSDTQIKAYNSISAEKDPFISLSYKSANGQPFCRSFARKACVWNTAGRAGDQCQNTPVRNSGNYCRRTNAGDHYRGMDGYYCNNGLYYNRNNPHQSNVLEQTRPFIIFEHSGGTHYCGGHDTTWNKVELWVQ
jgi:hypothetical protein